MIKHGRVILGFTISGFILMAFTLMVLNQGTTETTNVVSAEISNPIIDQEKLSSKKCNIYEECDNGCKIESQDYEKECCIIYNYCHGNCEEIGDCTGNCDYEP